MTVDPDLVRLVSASGRLEACVAPDRGAELCGLQVHRAGHGVELLYRGMDFREAEGWQGRAPILWPAIGRNFPPTLPVDPLTFRSAGLGWTHDGGQFPMPLHGFARALPWRIDRIASDRADLSLTDTPGTREAYPFGFRLAATYELGDDALTLTVRVQADPGNGGPMPFVLGNHLTLRAPPLSTRLDQGRVWGPSSRRRLLDPMGRPTGRSAPDPRFDTAVPLQDLIPYEVVVLEGPIGRPCSAGLRDEAGLRITVSHRGDDGADEAGTFLTFWGDPAQGYLALEPWLGLPNALASGQGAVRLQPGRTFNWSMTVVIESA